MCEGVREDYDEILRQHEIWIDEAHERREAETEAPVPSYAYEYEYAPHETHVAVEANVSVQQSIKIHHHAPLQAKAILALLVVIVALYLGYLLWPYRGLIGAILLALIALAALIVLLRLVWPLIEQIRAWRVEQRRCSTPVPHDELRDYRRGLEPENMPQYSCLREREAQR